MNFADRCNIAAGCLPKAGYREMLEKLHAEMLAELAQTGAVDVKDLLRRSRNMLSHPPLWWKTSEEIRERLIGALDAALHAAPQTGAEPVAWLVDVAEHQNQYAVIDADDAQLMDDCTNHGATVTPLYAAPTAQPAVDVPETRFWKMLDCEIAPRPLGYPLRDYHHAGVAGTPLHYTWTDKPHRLLYDLIAAVRYYAAAPLPAREPLTIATNDALHGWADSRKHALAQFRTTEVAYMQGFRDAEIHHGITTTPAAKEQT